MIQEWFKKDPRIVMNAPESSGFKQFVRIIFKDGSRMAQEWSKDGSRMVQEWFQNGSAWFKNYQECSIIFGFEVLRDNHHQWLFKNGPSMAQGWSKNGPRMVQGLLWMLNNPRGLSRSREWSSKLFKNGAVMVQEWSKNGPKIAQGWSKDGPRMVQGWSRMVQGWSRMVQGWSKNRPRMVQGLL